MNPAAPDLLWGSTERAAKPYNEPMHCLRVFCMLIAFLAAPVVWTVAVKDTTAFMARSEIMTGEGEDIGCDERSQVENCGVACASPLQISASGCLLRFGNAGDFEHRQYQVLIGETGPPDPHPPQSVA